MLTSVIHLYCGNLGSIISGIGDEVEVVGWKDFQSAGLGNSAPKTLEHPCRAQGALPRWSHATRPSSSIAHQPSLQERMKCSLRIRDREELLYREASACPIWPCLNSIRKHMTCILLSCMPSISTASSDVSWPVIPSRVCPDFSQAPLRFLPLTPFHSVNAAPRIDKVARTVATMKTSSST